MSKTTSKPYSFESLFKRFVSITVLILLALLAVIFYLTSASTLTITTVLLFVIFPYCFLAWRVKQATQTPLLGLAASLEAIRNEDYSLRVKPKFNEGAIKSLSDEVNFMADDLRIRKLHYDQQAVLVLKLIEQLATPIAMFDHKGRLNHGNDAFSLWSGKPWQQSKLHNAERLGLIFDDQKSGHWKIADKSIASLWQLRHSEFSMAGERYQLVVLTNIEKLVNETERVAWHKMTRVLSHEINNSLSPIKSLAHSLIDVFASLSEDKAPQEALDVIASRSDSLMQFVNRYASLNQQHEVSKSSLSLTDIVDKVVALFDHEINIEGCHINLYADPILLEQVLINLIKNAIEVSADRAAVSIVGEQSKMGTAIKIIDSGSGIKNPDNLFVPFYTTKQEGKGIGLVLSRNMIEQQGGRLTLKNRAKANGAEALIWLPH